MTNVPKLYLLSLFPLRSGESELSKILGMFILSLLSASVRTALPSRNTFAFTLSQLNSCSSSKIDLRCYFLQETVLHTLLVHAVSAKCFFKRHHT